MNLVPSEQGAAQALERVLITGDLGKLTPQERVAYYHAVCESLGLNPLTRPFEYIVLNGKLRLYARRDAADQIRKRDRISIEIVSRETINDLYIVVAKAVLPDGRADESTGVVSLAGLRGEALANAMMKAETKAKRRVTLSIAGLGWLDESEVEDIPGARRLAPAGAGSDESQPSPPPELEEGELVDPPPISQPLPPTDENVLKLRRRLRRLLNDVNKLSGNKRYNPYHLKNHLLKHFNVSTVDELMEEQLVEFGKQVKEELAALQQEQDSTAGQGQPPAESIPEQPPTLWEENK